MIPHKPESKEEIGGLVQVGYSREGELLYVNEGEMGFGFRICMSCGTRSTWKNESTCKNKFRGETCGGKFEKVTLGFKEQTDTLQISFNSAPGVLVPTQKDTSFWLSLMYALIHGASQTLQIERRDIDGVLFPKRLDDGGWQQTIVLYDDVPGGAGHVHQIKKEFTEVVRAALRVVNCVDCAPDSSCYHCLRDYNNQYHHAILERGPVAKFLEALLASLSNSDDPYGPNQIVALNQPRWLMQALIRAKSSLSLHVDALTLLSPSGESRTWLDVVGQLLARDVSVLLTLPSDFTPSLDTEGILISRQLQVLLDKGLQLYKRETTPEWPILIDGGMPVTGRALRLYDTSGLILDDKTGRDGLETIIHEEVLQEITSHNRQIPLTPITHQDLMPPPSMRVLDIYSTDRGKTESDFFGEVFEAPVQRLIINDRYLYDRYRIVERVGAYIEMAAARGALDEVLIKTMHADRMSGKANGEKQNQAYQALKKEFPGIEIKLERKTYAEHDRYVLLDRVDGSRARILIGKGLDFIRYNGEIEKTYVVIEDPYEG